MPVEIPAEGDSFMCRRDPRARVLLALLGSFFLAPVREQSAAVFGLSLALALVPLGGLPWRSILKRLAAINFFLLFLWLSVPFIQKGEIFSRAGVDLVLLVTLKSNALALWLVALLSTMTPAVLGYALERLRFPSKLVFLLVFTYRYVHVAVEEWAKLLTAAKLRGFSSRCGLRAYRSMGNLLGMTFIRSFERSLRVHEAMLLRGFAGVFRPVSSFRFSAGDMAFSLVIFLILSGIWAWDRLAA
ncbi:MAG: cobalt ECF transporter T component CbiQ [Desulfovibrionaceae bacterium]|nr:cobalt ECF transporter T component CbiQ [Desulfovibrionaceae bacterium]